MRTSAVALCAIGLMNGIAGADERVWTNPGGGAFGNSGNWQNGRIPGSSDLATFPVGSQYTVTLGGGRTVQAFQVLNGACTITGGQLDLNSVAIWNQFSGGVGSGGVFQLRSATLLSNTFHVGIEGRGAAAMIVSGQGALLRSEVLVGYLPNSSGQLLIENGGQVIASSRTPGRPFDGQASIGGYPNSQGSVRVVGQGSLLRAPVALELGGVSFVLSESRGTLLVEQGGLVEAGAVRITGHGNDGGGSITLQDAGTRMTLNSDLDLGNTRSEVSVLSGASLHAGWVTLASAPWSSLCNAVVRGQGSEVVLAHQLVVGHQGTAELQVDQQATLECGDLVLGVSATSEGVLSVDTGSGITAHGTVRVGDTGKGTWYAGSGCSVSVDGRFVVGANAGATGRMTFEVGDQGSLAFAGPWDVGLAGRGRLDLVGKDVTVPQYVICGSTGQGVLNILDGASISTESLGVAVGPGSTGKVSVQGAKSALFVGMCRLGGSGAPGGSGTLEVAGGASVRFSEGLEIWPGGQLNAKSGHVDIGGTSSGKRRGVLLGAGGAVIGGGLVRGDLTVVSGVLAATLPGSPLAVDGIIDIEPDLPAMEFRRRTPPLIYFEITGAGMCSQLACGGFAGRGARCQVDVGGGVVFAAGQDYRFVLTPVPTPLLLGAPFKELPVPNVGTSSDGKWLWMWFKSEPGVGITGKVRLAGDFNCDGVVDDADQTAFADATVRRDITTDLDSSGRIDANDLALFAQLTLHSR